MDLKSRMRLIQYERKPCRCFVLKRRANSGPGRLSLVDDVPGLLFSIWPWTACWTGVMGIRQPVVRRVEQRSILELRGLCGRVSLVDARPRFLESAFHLGRHRDVLISHCRASQTALTSPTSHPAQSPIPTSSAPTFHLSSLASLPWSASLPSFASLCYYRPP